MDEGGGMVERVFSKSNFPLGFFQNQKRKPYLIWDSHQIG